MVEQVTVSIPQTLYRRALKLARSRNLCCGFSGLVGLLSPGGNETVTEKPLTE